MYPFYEVNKFGDQNFFYSSIFSNFTFPPHLHPYVEMVYVIEGTTEVTVNDVSLCLNAGEAALCFPNDIHCFNSKENSKILIFIFSPDITGDFFGLRKDKTLESPFISKNTIDGEVSSLFFMLYDEYIKNNNRYVIKGLIYTILGKLDKYFILKNSCISFDNTTQTLMRYIEEHYQEKISLERIAKNLGFSKYYISRIFSNKIGYQFNDYVNTLRINKAQKLLSETDLTITIIAMECGFESQRNFNRIFKEFTSLTPTEFRLGRSIS